MSNKKGVKHKKKKAVGVQTLLHTVSWSRIKKEALQRKFGMIQDNNLEEKRRKKKARRLEKQNNTTLVPYPDEKIS